MIRFQFKEDFTKGHFVCRRTGNDVALESPTQDTMMMAPEIYFLTKFSTVFVRKGYIFQVVGTLCIEYNQHSVLLCISNAAFANT